jgi:uncharacterized DUF497 family protein
VDDESRPLLILHANPLIARAHHSDPQFFVYTKTCHNSGMEAERRFEWDNMKAAINFRRHGIQFEEAALAFDDPFAIVEQDRIENGEQRWQTIGMAGGFLLLMVAHTVRFKDGGTEVIRIISARRADRKERKRYEHG